MNLRQDLINVFKAIKEDDQIARLLYYDKDPLNTSKAEVNTLSDYQSIMKSRILRSPKTDDISTQQICRICMYMGNRRGQFNKQAITQDVVIDVYAHIDKFDMNDSRSLWICDRVAEILHDQRIAGMGKMDNAAGGLIGNPPSGYIGYKMIFTFGSSK